MRSYRFCSKIQSNCRVTPSNHFVMDLLVVKLLCLMYWMTIKDLVLMSAKMDSLFNRKVHFQQLRRTVVCTVGNGCMKYSWDRKGSCKLDGVQLNVNLRTTRALVTHRTVMGWMVASNVCGMLRRESKFLSFIFLRLVYHHRKYQKFLHKIHSTIHCDLFSVIKNHFTL